MGSTTPDNPQSMHNIVILVSGSGSNMQALIEAARRQQWESRYRARICSVISNRPQALALQKAAAAGIATRVVDHTAHATREAFDAALMASIDQDAPALVLLAGFMRVLTPGFVRHYAGRLVNIHPSLLPAFPGLHTHQRAIDTGCRVAGATVHWVDETLDGGAIIDQVVVPIVAGDSAEALAARVLSQEHLLFPRVVAGLLAAMTMSPVGQSPHASQSPA
jgi:phosphoribosylglycinamide formyltransferase 1